MKPHSASDARYPLAEALRQKTSGPPRRYLNATRVGLPHEKNMHYVRYFLGNNRDRCLCAMHCIPTVNLWQDNHFFLICSLPQATIAILCVVASRPIIHLGLLKVGEHVLASPSVHSPRIVVGLLSAVVKHYVGAARPAKDLTSKTKRYQFQPRALGQQTSHFHVVWGT